MEKQPKYNNPDKEADSRKKSVYVFNAITNEYLDIATAPKEEQTRKMGKLLLDKFFLVDTQDAEVIPMPNGGFVDNWRLDDIGLPDTNDLSLNDIMKIVSILEENGGKDHKYTKLLREIIESNIKE